MLIENVVIAGRTHEAHLLALDLGLLRTSSPRSPRATAPMRMCSGHLRGAAVSTVEPPPGFDPVPHRIDEMVVAESKWLFEIVTPLVNADLPSPVWSAAQREPAGDDIAEASARMTAVDLLAAERQGRRRPGRRPIELRRSHRRPASHTRRPGDLETASPYPQGADRQRRGWCMARVGVSSRPTVGDPRRCRTRARERAPRRAAARRRQAEGHHELDAHRRDRWPGVADESHDPRRSSPPASGSLDSTFPSGKSVVSTGLAAASAE